VARPAAVRHDLAFDRTLHIGDFLRPLVDQQHDQEAFRMIGGNGMRDVLQEHGLAGARRRHDQGALALADRRHDVDDARREVLLVASSCSIFSRSSG